MRETDYAQNEDISCAAAPSATQMSEKASPKHMKYFVVRKFARNVWCLCDFSAFCFDVLAGLMREEALDL